MTTTTKISDGCAATSAEEIMNGLCVRSGVEDKDTCLHVRQKLKRPVILHKELNRHLATLLRALEALDLDIARSTKAVKNAREVPLKLRRAMSKPTFGNYLGKKKKRTEGPQTTMLRREDAAKKRRQVCQNLVIENVLKLKNNLPVVRPEYADYFKVGRPITAGGKGPLNIRETLELVDKDHETLFDNRKTREKHFQLQIDYPKIRRVLQEKEAAARADERLPAARRLSELLQKVDATFSILKPLKITVNPGRSRKISVPRGGDREDRELKQMFGINEFKDDLKQNGRTQVYAFTEKTARVAFTPETVAEGRSYVLHKKSLGKPFSKSKIRDRVEKVILKSIATLVDRRKLNPARSASIRYELPYVVAAYDRLRLPHQPLIWCGNTERSFLVQRVSNNQAWNSANNKASSFLATFNIIEVVDHMRPTDEDTFFLYRPQYDASIPSYIKMFFLNGRTTGGSLEAFYQLGGVKPIEPVKLVWETYSSVSDFYARAHAAAPSDVGTNETMDMQAWLASYADEGRAPIQLMKDIVMAVGKLNGRQGNVASSQSASVASSQSANVASSRGSVARGSSSAREKASQEFNDAFAEIWNEDGRSS